MEEISGNSPSELLNLLVDGELESGQEVALYTSLTESDELRNEMREILAIRESIKKDTEAFTAPSKSRKAILTAVGLTPGGVINAPITQAAIQAGFWSGFWSKLWVPVASAVVATIITSLLFLNFYDKGNINTNTGSTLNKIPVVSSIEKTQPEKTLQGSGNIVKNPVLRQKKNTGINNYLPVAKNIVSNEDKTVSSPLEQSQTIEVASLGTEIYKPVSLNYTESRNYGIPVIALSPKQYAALNQGKLSVLDITLILRGISAKSFPTVDMPSQSNTLLSNLSVAGYVTLVEGLDVGFEAGQEAFGQVYLIKETNKIRRQNPLIFWFGPSIKWKSTEHVEFLAGAKPFAQVFIGGSYIGPHVRLASGLEYSWDSGLGFIIGVEGSSLFYNINEKWKSTEKLGFTYGVLYSF